MKSILICKRPIVNIAALKRLAQSYKRRPLENELAACDPDGLVGLKRRI